MEIKLQFKINVTKILDSRNLSIWPGSFLRALYFKDFARRWNLNIITYNNSKFLGTAPVISVSSGGEGVSGTTKIDLLPGSSINIFCNATGSPQPSVKWIRVGSIAIDPSTVKAEEISTRWSLKVVNITANTTFNCLAKNSLGWFEF